MADQQPLDFREWGRQHRGLAGQQILDTPEGRRRMLDLERQYDTYRKQFEKAPVQETTLSDGTPVAVLGNTMQVMRPPQPTPKYERGADGNLYLLDGTGASPVTNTVTGAPVQAPDRSGPDPMVLFSLGPQERAAYLARFVQPPAPGGGGPADQIFNNVPTAAPTPAATPAAPAYEMSMPTPGAAPAASEAMGVPAAAPAAAAAPAFPSVEAVLQAARSGQISKEEAQTILINQFGLNP